MVVVFKTKDEVVLIGAIEVGANGTSGPGVRRVVFLGAEDDIRRRKARTEIRVTGIRINGIAIGINDGERFLGEEFF